MVYFFGAVKHFFICANKKRNYIWNIFIFVIGYAILSKFEIEGNTVTFHKRYLQSDAFKRAIAAQKPVITEFGTKAYPDPNKGLLSRLVHSIVSITFRFLTEFVFFFLGILHNGRVHKRKKIKNL